MGIYFDTNIDYRNAYMAVVIENEMQRHKVIALEAISRVAHFEIEKIARVIAYSFLEEHNDAVNLAYKLDLSKVHFFAVLDDYDSFKELHLKDQEYLKELELAQNF